MSNQEQTQDQTELETTDTTYDYEMGEALARLKDNEDFKLLILDGYCGKKALDSVSMLAEPSTKMQGQRPDVMEDLVAISNFNFFLICVESRHTAALNPILSDKEEQEMGDH
ncbi:hypothetical protein vBAmePPT11V19_00018 [Alteromonas phage vB_AmeP_PT11-V19]|nr:hypothetical protein vBAmePPT11V19_00018 [Alteromonas phage vB_AmeP_PT11-V19]